MRKRQLLLVEWDDITGFKAWEDESETYKDTPIRCKTVGWKMKSNKGKLCVASTRSEHDMCCDRTIIPKGCIRSTKKL